MSDAVNHPKHYNGHPSGVEAIDVCERLNFRLGNAFKYVFRAPYKHESPLEDLKKALWYCERELAREPWKSKIEMSPEQAYWPEPGINEVVDRITETTEEPYRWILQAIYLDNPGAAAWMLKQVITAMEAAGVSAESSNPDGESPTGSEILRCSGSQWLPEKLVVLPPAASACPSVPSTDT